MGKAKWFFLGGLFAGAVISLYLASLYHQLTVAFRSESQFIPTRIYSDLTRIEPGQKRNYVERRLRRLGYRETAHEENLTFTPRPVDYPSYLLPDGNASVLGPVTLHFSSPHSEGVLQSIEADQRIVPELHLEPELIAMLSKGGDSVQQIRDPLIFSQIPSQVWKAIIAIEDQHFLAHRGLDPKGILRAIWVNLKTLSFAQGGSTITQQLVKNLMVRRSKNIIRKLNELILSLLLENSFDKEQILERYLNEVYLGQVGNLEVHGVAEGAEYFFGKKLDELNLGEIALMAGLIRGPGYYSPYRHRDRALGRQRLVLQKMVETGQIAEDEMKAALALPLRLVPPQNMANKAPYFADYVKAQLFQALSSKMDEKDILSAGLRVYTTLDPDLNQMGQEVLTSHLLQLEKRLKLGNPDRLEGVLAVAEPKTGYIRVLIGGRNYTESTFNRVLNMKRQIGSSFKPIVYLAAIEKGKDRNGISYGPGYPIPDTPWTLLYDGGRRSWSPKNYVPVSTGWINFSQALTRSINTSAARLGMDVGLDSIIETAQRLGIESPLPKFPALSLGVAELSPIEVLKAYATLANRGVQDDLTVLRGIVRTDGTPYMRFFFHPKPVFNPASIDLLTSILEKVFTEGTARSASRLGFNFPAAGKTGTTNDSRDSWFTGYTPNLAAVVWIGLDQFQTINPSQKTPSSAELSKRKKIRLTGASSALPVWVSFMKRALANQVPQPFPESPFLEEVRIDLHTGKKALSNCPASQVVLEKYKKDALPQEESCEPNWPQSNSETVREEDFSL